MIEKNSMEPLLLVEDKAELRAMLRKALERSGYAVEEAADGSTAVAKLRGAAVSAGLERPEAARLLGPGRASRIQAGRSRPFPSS